MSQSICPGIKNDPSGGMHGHGKMIRDAWIFDILPETEDCSGWTAQQPDNLYEQVAKAWSMGTTQCRDQQGYREALTFPWILYSCNVSVIKQQTV